MKKLLLFLLFLLPVNFLCAQEGSIVCLHGFFRSYKSMIAMGNALKKEGFKVYLYDYPSRRKTIEEHAQDLVNLLKQMSQEKPGEPIHFVTHSLGGIIVRAAVNHADCPQEAKMGKAVLLAPPNKGACLARHFRQSPAVKWLFGKKAGSQLLTYEEKDMNTFGQFPTTMEVVVISGQKDSRFFGKWIKKPNDGKVAVEETYLDTPHYHYTLYVSHSWIMNSRQSIDITKAFFLSK